MPDVNTGTVHEPKPHCLECGKPISPTTPHGVCPDCVLRNLLKTTDIQTGDFGSIPLIDFPDENSSIDDQGRAKSEDLLRPGERVGQFDIVQRLGRGGMGTVYEAQDTENQRRVALKVLIRPVYYHEARQRFLREGRLAASINHPNSVFVFGTHQVGQLSLISMELVNGGTLEQLIRANGPLTPAESVDAGLQIVDGLDAAYARGVLHRDIKPANCFLADDGTIKIGDFGLSISSDPRFDARLTTEGSFLGTPAFSSPEQLRGDAIDIRSDIYALGVTLYYLLTGRTPFQANNIGKLLSQVFESAAPTPISLRPEIPTKLSMLVMRCLAKEPGDRYRNYTDLREALIPFSSQATVPASLGWRTMAGLIDSCLLIAVERGCAAITLDPLEKAIDGWDIASRVRLVLSLGLCIFYFAAAETIFGRTLGKKLLGLKTVNDSGARPTFRQALQRSAFFQLFPVSLLLPFILLFGADGETAVDWSYCCLWGVMFSTARIHNGLAGLHELVSQTRVVSIVFEPVVPAQSVWTAESFIAGEVQIGPYVILDSINTLDGSEMYIGADPVMLRRVWLRYDPELAVDDEVGYRARLGRRTRLRWLNRFNENGKCWDVYETSAGQPLAECLNGDYQPWEQVKVWLGDLSRELRQAICDGTLPNRLSVEQLWLTDEGRLKVLDFSAPGVAELPIPHQLVGSGPQLDQSPSDRSELCLEALAPMIRNVVKPKNADTLPPPLYVTEMLATLETRKNLAANFKAIETAVSRCDVSPRRRRLMMSAACYAIPILSVLLLFRGEIFFELNEDLRELNVLVHVLQTEKSFKNGEELEHLIAQEPELEATFGEQIRAYRRYRAARCLIAGKYQGILEDPRVRLNAIWRSSPLREPLATALTMDLPSQKEMVDSADLLRTEIGDRAAILTQAIIMTQIAFIFSFSAWFLFVALPAAIAGLLFRGGLVIHGFQAAIVEMECKPAGRMRIFLRAMVAVVPGFATYQIMEFSTPQPLYEPQPLFIIVAITFVVLAGISNLVGLRSLPDRLLGTAVVSR